MSNYAQHMKSTQAEQAKPNQVANNAGGFVFKLDPWKQLERWLILGAEGGTYYTSERKLTRENAATVEACLKLDAKRAVATIVQISVEARAPKPDSAIFALALAALCNHAEAYAAIAQVCRTPTHLFQFVGVCEALGKGWGRGFKRAIASWYAAKTPEQLAMLIAKYPQRGGWSHRDLLRLSHWEPKAEQAAVARYVVTGAEGMGDRTVVRGPKEAQKSQAFPALPLPEYLQGFDELKTADEQRTIQLIDRYHFTHEMIDSRHKNSAEVWEHLLTAGKGMPMTALIRNLGKMSAVGLLKPLSSAIPMVCERLTDQEALKKARIHPMNVLTALKVYGQGRGDKGSLTWEAVGPIKDALDAAFYLSFGAIPKTGKGFFVALDVSGSMTSPISGMSGLTCREAAAVMAMATVRTEPNYHVMGFMAGSRGYGGMHGGDACKLVDINISAKTRLDDAVRLTSDLPFGGTDCSLPMLHAMKHKLKVDCFQVFTDNETWAGHVHPFQALKDYRRQTGNDAKLVVCGMTSTGFTIADPSDAGMLDVVGLDSAMPAVVAEFARG